MSENMKLEFVCKKCKKRQKLEVGEVYILYSEKEKKHVHYGREVRCKFCESKHMEPSYLELTALVLHKVACPEYDEVTLTRETVGIEDDKFMPFSEVEPYFEKRMKEEPENGELRLRYANFLKRINEYDKAITKYEESLQLDSTLIASLINLTDIFHHRYIQYKEKGAITKAKEYFEKAVTLYESGNATFVTLLDKELVSLWIEDRKEALYPKKRKGKRKKSKKRKK